MRFRQPALYCQPTPMPSQSRRSAALLAAALLCAFAHGQGLDQSAPTPPTPTFELNANLLILDVVATDSQGNPVRGLKASDFTVLENGRPQPISIFQPHDYDVNENAGAQPIMPHLGPGVFTNYTPQPTNGAMNILLFDVLDTRMIDWEYARAQAEKYLKESPLDGRMAVFALTARLRELQSFTSDRSRLTAALDSRTLNDLWKDQYSNGVHQISAVSGGKEPSRPIAHTRLIINVPARGDHFLRVGVRDPTTNDIGALEVPLAEVDKLPAVEADGARGNGGREDGGQGGAPTGGPR